MFNRKAPKKTTAESEFEGQAKLAGCVCCALWSAMRDSARTGMLVEFNHHLHAGRRMGHGVGSGECQWHHRGVQLPGLSKDGMTLIHGPSRANGSKPFHAAFGTDERLRQLTIEAVARYF